MNYSRRDLTLLLPAFAAARALAADAPLPSKVFPYGDLPVKTHNQNSTRAMLNGEMHTGYRLEAHETELAPGGEPHPPHHHVHEEMLMIWEGTLEVTIAGHSTTIGPGSAAYVASNEVHGWRNVGSTRAKYFVLAFGSDAK